MSWLENCSDAELVDQCNTGDREDATRAFDTLYARHKDYVLCVAFRYMRDTNLALDVLQETFIYLLRQFPPPGAGLQLNAKLQTLLYTVAKNHAISILRKTARTEHSGDYDMDEFPAAEHPVSELGRLLGGLSPAQREIVTLRFVDDLALADIAQILDLPLGTIKSRLHTAVRALRNSPYVKEFFDK